MQINGRMISNGYFAMARVLVIGDTHCPAMKEGYVDFLKDVQETWDCDTVVHIGDVVDWASI